MGKIAFGLFGAGGFGREVMPYVGKSVGRTLDIPESMIELFFVETWESDRKNINGYPLISLDAFKRMDGEKYFNVAVGDGRDRAAMVEAVGDSASPLSVFSDSFLKLDANHLGIGGIFCPNSMVTSNARVGRFFHCNIYSYVAHDCVIGDYVTFAPGVRCNGRVHIGDNAYLGTNAVIREGSSEKPLRIGKGAVIGMGAVVTRDVPDGVVVVGNPARPMVKK